VLHERFDLGVVRDRDELVLDLGGLAARELAFDPGRAVRVRAGELADAAVERGSRLTILSTWG
jgi:hypothetical protein